MNSRTQRSRRRSGLARTVVLAVLGAIAAGWILNQLRPRDASFNRRRGQVISAVVTADTARPDKFVAAAVRLRSSTGLQVRLRVLRPAGTRQPLPLVVILGGHGTGRDAVDLVGNPGPVVVAALEYPYEGPDRPRGWTGILRAIPAIQRALFDTPAAISLALDWLVEQPWTDPTRVELVGASLGVPFAAIAGAQDPRFRRVWLIHGAAGNRRLLEYNLRPRIPNRWLRHGAANLLYLLAYGPTFEPTRWVPRIAPRAVVIIGAADDERLPRDQVQRLYDVALEPRTLLWTRGRHIQPDRPEVLQQVLDLVRRRLSADRSDAPPLHAG